MKRSSAMRNLPSISESLLLCPQPWRLPIDQRILIMMMIMIMMISGY